MYNERLRGADLAGPVNTPYLVQTSREIADEMERSDNRIDANVIRGLCHRADELLKDTRNLGSILSGGNCQSPKGTGDGSNQPIRP